MIARIIWGERLNVSQTIHPWLELARVSHHGLHIDTPSAALLAIEYYIGNRNLPDPRLIGSLEGNGPNQVVTLINPLAELRAPKQRQNDQSNDKGIAQFVP